MTSVEIFPHWDVRVVDEWITGYWQKQLHSLNISAVLQHLPHKLPKLRPDGTTLKTPGALHTSLPHTLWTQTSSSSAIVKDAVRLSVVLEDYSNNSIEDLSNTKVHLKKRKSLKSLFFTQNLMKRLHLNSGHQYLIKIYIKICQRCQTCVLLTFRAVGLLRDHRSVTWCGMCFRLNCTHLWYLFYFVGFI